jgi:hypothetical protein
VAHIFGKTANPQQAAVPPCFEEAQAPLIGRARWILTLGCPKISQENHKIPEHFAVGKKVLNSMLDDGKRKSSQKE